DKTKKDLREDLGLSPSTLAKMSRGEYVALSVIARICEYLDCRIEEVVEFVHSEEGHLRHRQNRITAVFFAAGKNSGGFQARKIGGKVFITFFVLKRLRDAARRSQRHI